MGGRRFSLSWKQQAFILSLWLLNAGVVAVTWGNHTGFGMLCSASPWESTHWRTWQDRGEGAGAAEVNSVSDTHFVLVLDCFCACTVLGLVSKLIHKNHASAQEKRGRYRLSYWWETGVWVWVSFGSRCTVPCQHLRLHFCNSLDWPESLLTQCYSLPMPLLICDQFRTEHILSSN